VAELFGLSAGREEVLYDRFKVSIRPGQIVAVVGPSGAGKSVLLRGFQGQVAESRWIDPCAFRGVAEPAISALPCGLITQRLEALSMCGLAEAAVMVTPAERLSGGQAYRLALAGAILEARRAGRPMLLIADEFASVLDDASAAALCQAMRRLIDSPTGSNLSLLVATARSDLLAHLRPNEVIFKPLGGPAEAWQQAPGRRGGRGSLSPTNPRRWRIVRGSLRDYRLLAGFHYLTGPPALHKRVYVIRPSKTAVFAGQARAVAVLVISPPLPCVRGRNIAAGGRYARGKRAKALARLNSEVEAISRVVVHPSYRGLGLAGRLVRHALASAQVPLVETLAAMGRVHPLFERAGMSACYVPAPGHRRYVYYYWIAPPGHRAYHFPPDVAKRRLAKASVVR
jgi:ABC-type ATPase with predicted acetyltransferase domain